jgi:hypothetical protein
MKTHHWLTWTHIAIEHEHEAHEARAVEIRSGGEQPQYGEALAREMKASLITVAGAAHALDALYGAVKPFIPIDPKLSQKWRENRTPREKQILETLKAGFDVGRHAKRWATALEWLFDLRDAAVHPEEEFAPPLLHVTGTNVAAVYGTYNSEAATGAIDLVIEIASVCVSAPRSKLPEVVGWAESMKNSVAAFPARP